MGKNNNSVVIKLLSEKPIAFSPMISKAVGSITTGLLLQQLLYWTGKGYDENGWIYKSVKEMDDETSLTERQQEGAIKKLIQFKLIEVESREKGQWKTSRRFRVIGGVENVAKFVSKKSIPHRTKGAMGEDKMGDGPQDKMGDVLYTENTRTENTTEIAPASGADEIINLFDTFKKTGLCPMINFGNKTQRAAAGDLIKKFGLEKMISAVKYAASISGDKYAPVITTPLQLKEKIGLLIVYSKKNNTKNNYIKIS